MLAPMSLPACPKSPNCVSSQAADPAKRVAPLDAGGDARAALERLARWIEKTPRAAVLSQTPDTLHAVFTSLVFRFKDDVHVETGEADGRPVLHVRSASRVGYGDLGANRRRVERLREVMSEPPA